MSLAWPQQRPDPLRAFHIYPGGFNVFDLDYLASLAWCSLWAGILAGAVVIGPFLYALYRVARYLLTRHAIIELTPGRSAGPTQQRAAKAAVCVAVFVGAAGGAAAIWVSGNYIKNALDGALNAGLDWIASFLAQAQTVQLALGAASAQLPAISSFYDPVSSAVDSLTSLSHAAEKVSARLFGYWAMARMAATLVGAGFILLSQMAVGAALLSSRRVAGLMAGLLWVLLILAWLVCGATYVATLATQDACLALDSLAAPGGAARVHRLTRCSDQGDNITSQGWGAARGAADALNAALLGYSTRGTGAGMMHLAAMTFKCNPAAPRNADGLYTAATVACPNHTASIDALADPSRTFLHTVAANSSFAAAYAHYRCGIDDATACYGAGEIPASAFDALAADDDATRQLVAAMPALDTLSRCTAVDELLSELAATHCPRMRFATRLLFAGFLASCGGFTAAFFGMLWGSAHFNPRDALCGCAQRRGKMELPVFVHADEGGGGFAAGGVPPNSPSRGQALVTLAEGEEPPKKKKSSSGKKKPKRQPIEAVQPVGPEVVVVEGHK